MAGACAVWASLLAPGCIEPLSLDAEPPASELAVGETRRVELRFMRLDVEGFGKTVTIDTLRSLPKAVLDDVWLLDMELTGLVRNALEQLRDLPAAEAASLPVAAQNMRRLLRTTPDNAILDGTSLEELIGLSAAIGIPAPRALADILQVGITEEVIPIDSAARATVDGLITSHPNAQTRRGPIDDAHPDGLWPVAPSSIPLTLGDVVNNFEELPARFGPMPTEEGKMHPGFIEEAEGFSVIDEEFAMTMKVTANALPFKGVDLRDASIATVNSKGGQIETLFDTSDPEWLTVVGLVENPAITVMTVRMVENDAFVPGGDARDPLPTGNSPVWQLDPWEFERLVAEMVVDAASTLSDSCVSFELGTGAEAFRSCVDPSAWVTFETFNDIGNPPAPAYMWDLQMELAQVRLHDGGLAEGEGDVQFTLYEVPLGVSADEITQDIADNIAANPSALRELANQLTDATDKDADFFYVVPAPDAPDAVAGDWLYFVAETDIPVGENGDPIRPYDYEFVGFFADAALTEKVSDTIEVEGDLAHEKVRVSPGDVLYMRDDAGRTHRIDVLEKPSPFKVALDLTRLD